MLHVRIYAICGVRIYGVHADAHAVHTHVNAVDGWMCIRRIRAMPTTRMRKSARAGCDDAHDAPWSPDSRHVEKTRLWEITSPPPKPSLALIPARGPLKKTLPAYAYGHMLMRAVEEDITYVASACAHMHMQVVLSHMHMHMHAPAARSAWHAHAPGSACTLHPCTMHAYHAGACGPRGPRGPCIPCIPRIPCIPCRCMRATWAMHTMHTMHTTHTMHTMQVHAGHVGHASYL